MEEPTATGDQPRKDSVNDKAASTRAEKNLPMNLSPHRHNKKPNIWTFTHTICIMHPEDDFGAISMNF